MIRVVYQGINCAGAKNNRFVSVVMQPFDFVGVAAVVLGYAKLVCMKTSGECPATELHGNVQSAAAKMDLATNS
jgi:hypothetical protein